MHLVASNEQEVSDRAPLKLIYNYTEDSATSKLPIAGNITFISPKELEIISVITAEPNFITNLLLFTKSTALSRVIGKPDPVIVITRPP